MRFLLGFFLTTNFIFSAEIIEELNKHSRSLRPNSEAFKKMQNLSDGLTYE